MMTDKDIKETLTRNSIGRLGCSHEDQPYVLPISFVYDHDCLFCFAIEGQKIDWMRTNPKVCVEIDEISDRFHWASVVLLGHYRELPNLPKFADEIKFARTVLASRSLWWEPALSFRSTKINERPTPIFYTIKIASMTGYHTVARQPHGLNHVPGHTES
jgi:nitroimidazol reductase NimA-like FMN-containing flavoprotein (pyridoxamine 5'-phosphate oxidase superfamily)